MGEELCQEEYLIVAKDVQGGEVYKNGRFICANRVYGGFFNQHAYPYPDTEKGIVSGKIHKYAYLYLLSYTG